MKKNHVYINTQYMKNSTVVYPHKMEYGWNFQLKFSIIIWTQSTTSPIIFNTFISRTGGPELSTRLSAIYTELEVIESDTAPSRAAVILCGLGFTAEKQGWPTKSFSGGWRMRLALARALFCKPDLLLLDEPTNMLDMQAIIWLERYLQNWPSTLLVVSHDRNFLDEVPTDMLHLHSKKMDSYRYCFAHNGAKNSFIF